MANHIVNDKGEIVCAVGAPGSIERLKVEYPKLISELTDDNYFQKLARFPNLEAKGLVEIAGLTELVENRIQDLATESLKYQNNMTWEEESELSTLKHWL